MKTISANAHGITIIYENTGHSSFIRYEQNDKVATAPKPRAEKTYNPIQQNMLNRVLKGLNYYTPDELKGISKEVQALIAADHKKAQFTVRKLKVDRYYQAENKLLNKIFPHARLGTKIIDYYIGCNQALSMGFEDLKIEIAEVTTSLINTRLLPKDFASLNFSSVAARL